MNIEIKKLSPEMSFDYVDFFDNRAFSDGNINKGCYCVWHHWTDKHEYERSLLPKQERAFVKRNYAIQLIERGKLNGFVAYDGNKIIGFCNADVKDNYFRLSMKNDADSWQGINPNDKILCIVCFVVDPNMRGRGIAKALLKAICKYAKENNFNYVESYPNVDKFVSTNCCGPASMYKTFGFELIECVDGVIARKRISN